jgi:N-formylglutamate amidohydrolase
MATLATVAAWSAPPVPALPAQELPPLLVQTEAGDMPIILTAPHGGNEEIPGVPRRTSGVTTQDARTLEITQALLARLQTQYCQRPYAVMALYHRRYLDANRAEREAFEQPAARPYHAAYHDTIRGYVDEIRQRFPGGALLVDIHGQAADPGTIHRGTQNGRTMARIVERRGEAALVGESSVFGQLQTLGYSVFPPSASLGSPRENPSFNGGFTVQTYGSHHENGIDAIQIELGSELRQPATIPQVAADLAEAIGAYYRAYLGGESRCAGADLAPDPAVTRVTFAEPAIPVR